MAWYDGVKWQHPTVTRSKLTNLGKRSPEFQQAYTCAIKDAISWLHHEAETMDDWRAKKILNAAASQFGMAVSRRRSHPLTDGDI